jgi:indolepyruvate ferredoxin oxidoreductase alpha subunit
MKELLIGNEAIARGAYESNVWAATGYPGTPSSEIIETLAALYPEIDSEWSVNEKVAVEIAHGASIAGIRSIATMKHVGLNVAADPFMTAAYTGVNAGLVIVVADDPSLHSSQNEQDNRIYGKFAKVPVFEPADSQEAKDMVKLALEVSEQFDTPSILRPVTRVCHTKTPVLVEEPARERPVYKYVKNAKKYVMVPGNACVRHEFVLERFERLRRYSESFPLHKCEMRDTKIGIVTHGYTYNYVREVMPDASVFSIAMYPIPLEKIREFASKVEKLYVVEELEPVIEETLKAAGIACIGKEIIPQSRELTPEIIAKAFGPTKANTLDVSKLPPRPPSLCKGCGHIYVFNALKELQYTVLGDIGCYTLGVMPPYDAMDTTVCMGASVGNEAGFRKAAKICGAEVRSVGVIGDSTFFHSGMTGVLDAVYNRTPITLIILDNRITAMTGHQPSPNTGLDSRFSPSVAVDLEQVVRGLGVKRVRRVKVTAMAVEEIKNAIREEVAADEPSVLIMDEFCVIAEPKVKKALQSAKE